MNTIPEICRLPGYIFPNGTYEGQVSEGVFRVHVKSAHYQGDAILNKKNAAGLNLQRGETIETLVVIAYDPKTGLFVAQDNYFESIIKFFFFTEKETYYFVKSRRFEHWEEDWGIIFSRERGNYDPWQIETPARKDGLLFEFKGKNCLIPVHDTPLVKYLKGKNPNYFPASLYDSGLVEQEKKNQFKYKKLYPRSLFKTDGIDIELPAYFKGKVDLENCNTKKAEKNVHIYVYGFTSPAKWHYGVLKHMLGINGYGSSQDKEYWEAFSGKRVAPIASELFRGCKSRESSCDEGLCLRNGLFKEIHKWIRSYCHDYLKQAIRFFGKESDKTIFIWQRKPDERKKPDADKYKQSKFIQIECHREIKDKPNEKERKEILILYGHCYDWDIAEEPTLHLFIVTLYAGHPRERRKSSIKEVPGHIIVNQGNISINR